jgi:hypothetical protein
MSYAFRGSPWKNIDFFTPASGDSALLDTFCLVDPPSSGMVAGKVDLNTRQAPVIQALVSGAYRDEYANTTTNPTYALPPLNGTEAAAVASTLVKITSDMTDFWRGPLTNLADLVGHYVPTNPAASSSSYKTDTDYFTYTPPSANPAPVQATPSGTAITSMTYSGLSAALQCNSFFGTSNNVYATASNSTAYSNNLALATAISAPAIQRFREAALRPLVDAGQVRVWNLLIDVVAQTGRYPTSATALNQFVVEGQTHLWVHVAIDRYTGQVIDKQIEVVTP